MRRWFHYGSVLLALALGACAASPPPASVIDAFAPQPGETAAAFENRCIGYVTDHTSYGDAARCMNKAASMRRADEARMEAEARAAAPPPPPAPVAARPLEAAAQAPCGTSISDATGDGGKTVAVTIAGQITLGCAGRLTRVLADARTHYPGGKLYFVLNSPGGALRTALEMGQLVAEDRLPVVVPPRAICASACFLILAASQTKYVAASARVGVHSAAQFTPGHETEGSKAITTDFARILAQFGVPSDIIGHLVETPPGAIYWLTPAELMAMGVHPLPT